MSVKRWDFHIIVTSFWANQKTESCVYRWLRTHHTCNIWSDGLTLCTYPVVRLATTERDKAFLIQSSKVQIFKEKNFTCYKTEIVFFNKVNLSCSFSYMVFSGKKLQYLNIVFSSPELEVLMVSYCGQWLSVVRRRPLCVVRRPSSVVCQHLMFTL